MTLVNAIRLASMKLPFNFKAIKSNKMIYVAKYVDDNCEWRMLALNYKLSERFRITKYSPMHTCGVQHLISNHKQASTVIISGHMMNKFLVGKGHSSKENKSTVKIDL